MSVHFPASPGRRPAWRWACVCIGLLLAGLALALAYGAMGGQLYVHASGVLLMADLAPLLIALGLALGLTRRPSLGLRVVAHPLLALPLWAIALGVWHLPGPYEAALRDPTVQALRCATLFACGLNMWVCLLGVVQGPRWFGGRARVAGIFGSRLFGAILANVLLWSNAVFYSSYIDSDALRGLSPLADQNMAGAIVLAQESLLTLGLLCWLLACAVPGSETPPRKASIKPMFGVHPDPVPTGAYAESPTGGYAEPATAAYAEPQRAMHAESPTGTYPHRQPVL
jgi:cytochrome c oxidase assembly factor CtaG